MVVGSLFSGAGLLDAGLHQAGLEHAWFVEREPDRRGLLGRRWPGRPVHNDVRTVGAHNLERVDGIVGGFPCKGVSGAGLGAGLAHPETALWAEFARIVGELQPAYVLVENVARILTLHGGDILRVVVGDLAALGFDVAWDCVRASDVGAPHGRDRWFAVARHPDRLAGPAPVAGGRRRGALARPSAVERAIGSDGLAAVAAHTCSGGQRPDERYLRAGQPDAEGRPVADAGCERGELRGGPAGVAGAGGAAEGQARERQRARDAAGDSREAAADADDGRQPQQPERHGEQREGLHGQPRRDAERHGVQVEWGSYEPAVRRWEAIHGPAPAPLTRLCGLDDGDTSLRRVWARMDRQRLSALGDGVHVYVGRLLGDALMELARNDREARDAA